MGEIFTIQLDSLIVALIAINSLRRCKQKMDSAKIVSQIPLEIDLVWLERKAIVQDDRFTLTNSKKGRGG